MHPETHRDVLGGIIAAMATRPAVGCIARKQKGDAIAIGYMVSTLADRGQVAIRQSALTGRQAGERMAALEPVAQGVLTQFGTVERGAAAAWRCEWTTARNTSPTTSTTKSKLWGIVPSFAFSPGIRDNRVVECFIRATKERTIYGRILLVPAEVRESVAELVDHYNHKWRGEKNSFRSPYELRGLQDFAAAARGASPTIHSSDDRSSMAQECIRKPAILACKFVSKNHARYIRRTRLS